MKGKLLIKLGAPILAVSLITACGTTTKNEPVREEVPIREDKNLETPADNGELNRNDGNNLQDDLNRNGENRNDGRP